MDKPRACSLCRSFIGYGLHWAKGRCSGTGKEISLLDYRRTAEACPDYATDFASACEGCAKGPDGDGSCAMAAYAVAGCSDRIGG